MVSAESLQWTAVDATGDAPSPRYGHVGAVIGNMLYIFGGRAGSELFNDVFALDLGLRGSSHPAPPILTSPAEKKHWTAITPAGQAPSPRAGAVAAAFGRRLFVFGGRDGCGYRNDLFVLDTGTCPRGT